MRSLTRIAALLLCAAILLTLAGCSQPADSETTEGSDSISQEDTVAFYENASNAAAEAQNLIMQIDTQTNMTAHDTRFEKSQSQTLTCLNQAYETAQMEVSEVLTIGSQNIQIREVFTGGNGYFTVNGSQFITPMTPQEFRARYAPTALLDAAIYGKITVETTGTDIVISFSEPSSAESWAVPAEAQLVTASGQAVISDGVLTGCTYSVTYIYGTVNFEKNVTVSIDTASLPSISIPASSDGYTPITDPDAPRLLEEACGYLMQAQVIRSQTSYIIDSEAFGINRSQESSLAMDNSAELLAQLDTKVVLMSQSLGGESTETIQKESFSGGQYTIATNGGEPEAQPLITSDKMLSYCRELLVGTIMLPEYIADATITEAQDTYQIDFTGTEELARLLGGNACKTLYDNAQLLDDLASAYSTTSMTCYLTLDKYSGLPVAAGIHYSGKHTIQETAYLLTYDTDQQYDFTSSDVSELPTDTTEATETIATSE